jgi:hypothetical protein
MGDVIGIPRIVPTGPHSLLSIIAEEDGRLRYTVISLARPPNSKKEHKITAPQGRKRGSVM